MLIELRQNWFRTHGEPKHLWLASESTRTISCNSNADKAIFDIGHPLGNAARCTTVYRVLNIMPGLRDKACKEVDLQAVISSCRSARVRPS